MNSAKSGVTAYEQARKDYLACQGPAAQGAAAMEDASGVIDRVVGEAKQLLGMNEFLLRQMQRELDAESAINGLTGIATKESNAISAEIARLQSEIRTSRRRFLDASPSVSPAVGGLYFTKVPDNQVLIAFLACFGAALVAVSLLILMNQLPFLYFTRMANPERVKLVGMLWLVSLIAGYAGFFMFT